LGRFGIWRVGRWSSGFLRSGWLGSRVRWSLRSLRRGRLRGSSRRCTCRPSKPRAILRLRCGGGRLFGLFLRALSGLRSRFAGLSAGTVLCSGRDDIQDQIYNRCGNEGVSDHRRNSDGQLGDVSGAVCNATLSGQLKTAHSADITQGRFTVGPASTNTQELPR
jgi:hypothetical protein